MTFRQAPPTIATASDKKNLLLAFLRNAKTKSASLFNDYSARVIVVLSGGVPHLIYPVSCFCRPCYSHNDYRTMNYIDLTGVQLRRV